MENNEKWFLGRVIYEFFFSVCVRGKPSFINARHGFISSVMCLRLYLSFLAPQYSIFNGLIHVLQLSSRIDKSQC